jgi:hypothetical protein
MRSAVGVVLATWLLASGCDCAGERPDRCAGDGECAAGERCLDRRCVPGLDASFDANVREDAAVDASARDAPRPDTSFDANCVVTECRAAEGCGDGLDEDCDGVVDEGCACVPGSTARCLPGRLTPDLPRCSWGEMACDGPGEFGGWGPCSGGGEVDGGMSLYGCRRIGILGAPGANASSNFQAWLEMQGAIVMRFHDTAGAATLRIEELRTFDLVVVDWLQRTYSMAEADTLSQWVNEGGGLFVMTGHDSGATAARQVSLLTALGPNYDLRACGSCEATEVCDGGHCVLNGPATLLPAPISLAPDGVSTLPPVSFFGGLRVTVPAAMASTFTPFATVGSYVVGAAGPIGMGRAVVFGDEWIEFDSEWSTMPPIPRFWENAVRWLAPDEPVLPACE